MNVIDAQARDLISVVPSDTVSSIAKQAISLYVGTTGNIAVVTEANWDLARKATGTETPTVAQIVVAAVANSLSLIVPNCPAGFVLNCRISAVLATGTTASNLIGYLP